MTGADVSAGWSTSIPCFNPEEIVANIRRLMNGEEQVPMMPWWRGFKGIIKKVGDNKYDVLGCVEKTDDTTVEITELPIGKWTQNYKAELEAMCGEKGDGPIKVGVLPTFGGFILIICGIHIGLQRVSRQHERSLHCHTLRVWYEKG